MSQLTWQDFLNILTKKGSDTGILFEIKDLPEDILKFQLCYDENKHYLEEWLASKIVCDTKSSSKSVEHRINGNKVYQKGNDVEALNIYNLSTTTAPYNTNAFALAVSNRSAVLGRLNYFREAIRDVDLALKHGDNEIPRKKLLIRKALLLHKLHLYKDTIAVIKSLFPDEDQIRNNENVELTNVYFDALQQNKETEVEHVNTTPTNILPIPKGGENGNFPSASVQVSLKYSKEKGRHVIADEHFEKSDIIFVEKPFALVVLPDRYEQHCHHCCKTIVAFIPCQMCTRAFFCSEQCCEEAWSRYHQWECKGLEVCHSIGIAHLGLRVALMADGSSQYQQVYDLVTHIDDMKAEDIYQYTITAALMTVYLEQYTSYFVSHPSSKVEEMGCRILRHIAQLICNGHAITKIEATSSKEPDMKTTSEEQVRIATAIYPSASMMNHSCDQNICNNFIDEYLVVTASKPIKKGEEVFNCYGPNHKTMGREERQQILQSQYFFNCKCPWCLEASKKKYQQFSALQCQFCFGPVMPGHAGCADCHRGQPLSQLMDMALVAQQAFHKGQQFFKTGDVKKAQQFLEESVKLSKKCLYKHNSDLRNYKDFLARTYAELGNYRDSIQIVEDCIISVEAQFGVDSVELSRDLLKLLDLVNLDMARLLEDGKQNSEEYRLKHHKKEKLIKKIKKFTEGNENLYLLNEVPELTTFANCVQI